MGWRHCGMSHSTGAFKGKCAGILFGSLFISSVSSLCKFILFSKDFTVIKESTFINKVQVNN